MCLCLQLGECADVIKVTLFTICAHEDFINCTSDSGCVRFWLHFCDEAASDCFASCNAGCMFTDVEAVDKHMALIMLPHGPDHATTWP